jgi:predicted AlkP superfamily pyrophosphatase or phosphodiesterase
LNKVILVLSDGLRYDAAVAGMGFLGHLVEVKLAGRYKVIGELPSISRPMYETIHSGLPASLHGIISNKVVRKSVKPNIFQLVHEAGGTTAAAAYYWFSELYNRAPYDRVDDREVDDSSLLIQHGRFYTEDDYPDKELFNTAGMLVRRYAPNYLLVHPMGMDYIGGTQGGTSSLYRKHALSQDMWLATCLSEWMDAGYNILVTGDHGMSADGFHGGTTSEEREVPLFLVQPGINGTGDTQGTISQLQLAPTICKLLGIPIPESMKAAPFI